MHVAEGECVAAVLHTPPHAFSLSLMDPEVATFAARTLGPVTGYGLVGAPEVARVFADANAASITMDHEMGLYELTAVRVALMSGARLAEPADAPLLQEWVEAFHAEAVPHDPVPAPDAGAKMIERGGVHLWCVDAGGPPRAWASFGRRIEGARQGRAARWVSVGPVYTPPQHRGRGYATGLVAQMSALALARGELCTLFTDLRNPTSNAIYERIGYERVGTVARYRSI